ncbi:MAG: LysR family transcriptional regulator [Hyphomicrobiales bacterium]|nr:MAG: LysR family transcriptional regulator [Hyphomicrobiales bacterium]
MRINLPTDLLRTLVTIVDTGSMVRASERVFLTQSALSLQMKRLADIIQRPIFIRHHGSLVLTPVGERLVARAREILVLNDNLVAEVGHGLAGPVRVGMTQDFADAILSGVLCRFKHLNPEVRLEIRVSNSDELTWLYASGMLDIALHLADPDASAACAKAQMVWLGDPDLLLQPILPLAIMTKPCRFRDAAVEALDSVGRSYVIALETPSISALRAAVESGLAATCRTVAFLGNQFKPLNLQCPLPEVAYMLSACPSPNTAISDIVELIRGSLKGL